MLYIHKRKHEVCDQDGNEAQGKVKYFINVRDSTVNASFTTMLKLSINTLIMFTHFNHI